VYKVALATNTSFEDIKGEIEAILAEMNIVDWQYQKSNVAFFTQGQQVHITCKDCIVATVGQVRKKNALAAGMKFDIYMASLDLQALIERAKTIPNYRPINPFASIKLDVTLDTAGRTYAEILKIINDSSPKVEQVHYLSSFKTSVTVRITMNRNDANMTEQEAQEELKKIQEALAAA
jgi:phenylalanyl-tRNA synthetase beta subunit